MIPDKFTTGVMEKLAEQKPEKILSGKVIHSFVKRFPGDVLQQKAFWIVLLLFVLWLFFGKKGICCVVWTCRRALYAGRTEFLSLFSGKISGKQSRRRAVVQRMSHNGVAIGRFCKRA